MKPVGVVAIVTWNCREFIVECLRSIEPQAKDWDVVVADNGSTDGTVDAIRAGYPFVNVVALGSNRGFSAACNAAAGQSSAPWILFLNPDTIVPARTLDTLVEHATARDAAIVAPRLNNPDGTYQTDSADRRLPTTLQFLSEFLLLHRFVRRSRLGRSVNLPGFDASRAQRVEHAMAAALLVRRDAFESVGGFDERFHPIWFEDIDLCKRLGERGHAIWFEPDAVIIHTRQHSLPLFSTTAVQAMMNANAVRYVKKHFPAWQARSLLVAAVVGTLLRGAVRSLSPGATDAGPGHLRLAWRMMRHADEARWYA